MAPGPMRPIPKSDHGKKHFHGGFPPNMYDDIPSPKRKGPGYVTKSFTTGSRPDWNWGGAVGNNGTDYRPPKKPVGMQNMQKPGPRTSRA